MATKVRNPYKTFGYSLLGIYVYMDLESLLIIIKLKYVFNYLYYKIMTRIGFLETKFGRIIFLMNYSFYFLAFWLSMLA